MIFASVLCKGGALGTSASSQRGKGRCPSSWQNCRTVAEPPLGCGRVSRVRQPDRRDGLSTLTDMAKKDWPPRRPLTDEEGQRLQRNTTVAGGVAGAGAGALTGGIVGYLQPRFSGHRGTARRCAEGALLGSLVGAILGAVRGRLIGTMAAVAHELRYADAEPPGGNA